MADTTLWLDCRRTPAEEAARSWAEAAQTVGDMLPPVGDVSSEGRRTAGGTVVAGPVHGPAELRRVMRGLLAGAPATPAPGPRDRAVAVEYSVPAVDALVNAGLDRIGGCEAKAMRFRAGVAGAHLLYDMVRRDLRSPDWARAAARGIPAPYLLWSTAPVAGPDRGAEYAERCLFPGTAVALSPAALRTFVERDAVTGPTALDLVEARRVVGILDWFGIRFDTLVGAKAPATG
ncbi:beta/alpha barrel domain-containing protein [Streptomyces zaehneri]|uniref:hypothetical protein n=1 Tax=Streptomyces zaehneri TaxID=3051180 RepID=UPI0028D02AFC|nr:hypothetical protein [Streptomyces sp. DSM 40713]